MKQEISGAEDQARLQVCEGLEQVKCFCAGIGFCAWAFEMIEDGLPQRLPAQKSVTEPEHCTGNRGMVIDHDPALASGLQHAQGFSDALICIRTVMHNAVRVHDVEEIVGEGELFGVGDAEVGLIAGLLTTLTGAFD